VFIYLLENQENKKVYVGQTMHNPEERWKQHVRAAHNGSDLPVHRAIRKHGAVLFMLRILQEFAFDPEYANFREEWFIHYYDSTNPEKGYNLLKGACINTRSPEQMTKDGRKGGQIQGPKNVQSGHWNRIRKMGQVAGGKAIGSINLKTTREDRARGGTVQGKRNAESGLLAKNLHFRWHVSRHQINPNCMYCREIGQSHDS
jgi:group I intron endonuclease